MPDSNLPLNIPRDILVQAFNGNLRAVKAMEAVIAQLNSVIPQQISNTISSVSTVSGSVSGISSSISSVSSSLALTNSAISQVSGNLSNVSANLSIVSSSLSTMAFQNSDNVNITGGSINIDTLVIDNPDFIATAQTLNDYAGANTATFTNSPIAGNPTKWVKINDNGVIRYIALF